MDIRKTPLEEGAFYHIFNRGIDDCRIFLDEENMRFFLKKLKLYLLPVADIYAYCLLPHAFHVMIRVKVNSNLNASKQLGKLFSSYTQAFNKVNHRSGSLFNRSFKRKLITSEKELMNANVYIHQNCLDLGVKMEDYPFSSYKSIIGNKKTNVLRAEVIELFDTIENFKSLHLKKVDYSLDYWNFGEVATMLNLKMENSLIFFVSFERLTSPKFQIRQNDFSLYSYETNQHHGHRNKKNSVLQSFLQIQSEEVIVQFEKLLQKAKTTKQNDTKM